MYTSYVHTHTYLGTKGARVEIGKGVMGGNVGAGTGAGVVGGLVARRVGRGVGTGVNGILPCNRRVKKRVSSSSTLLMLSFFLLLYLPLLSLILFFLLFAIRLLLSSSLILISTADDRAKTDAMASPRIRCFILAIGLEYGIVVLLTIDINIKSNLCYVLQYAQQRNAYE